MSWVVLAQILEREREFVLVKEAAEEGASQLNYLDVCFAHAAASHSICPR